MEICEACKCDVSQRGFVCNKRLCPLDNFHPVGYVEIPAATAPRRRLKAIKRYMILPERLNLNDGQPAPSESLERYES